MGWGNHVHNVRRTLAVPTVYVTQTLSSRADRCRGYSGEINLTHAHPLAIIRDPDSSEPGCGRLKVQQAVVLGGTDIPA